MSRICLYYRKLPEVDRWVPGDRFIRPLVRRAIRGKPSPSGVDSVFLNLCKGLDEIGIPYSVNLPFRELTPDDRVGVLGRGRSSLEGYDRPNPIVAGIGLMTHPSEWPSLCDDFPVVTYLQHSEWTNDVYRPYFGDRCRIWPVGIDTDQWQPRNSDRTVDFLIYEKFQWNVQQRRNELLAPALRQIEARGLTFELMPYGTYTRAEYRASLARSRAMLFFSPHESQGLAYQECMSMDVPVLAWDQGLCLDPERFKWGDPHIPATSVPYFDERCGVKFTGASDFDDKLDEFLDALRSGRFASRQYVLEHLTLERAAEQFIDYLDAAQTPSPGVAAAL